MVAGAMLVRRRGRSTNCSVNRLQGPWGYQECARPPATGGPTNLFKSGPTASGSSGAPRHFLSPGRALSSIRTVFGWISDHPTEVRKPLIYMRFTTGSCCHATTQNGLAWGGRQCITDNEALWGLCQRGRAAPPTATAANEQGD
jgi:hypothetical protein